MWWAGGAGGLRYIWGEQDLTNQNLVEFCTSRSKPVATGLQCLAECNLDFDELKRVSDTTEVCLPVVEAKGEKVTTTGHGVVVDVVGGRGFCVVGRRF
jgi:hypothetical protein